MARFPRYTWQDATRRYRSDRTGRFVPASRIRQALDSALDREQDRSQALATSLRSGAIGVDQWELQMREMVKTTHLYSAAAAKGGWAQLGAEGYGIVGQRVRFQFERLTKFAEQLRGGLATDGAFLNRAQSYAQAGRLVHGRIERDGRVETGAVEERNIQDDGAKHCGECPRLTAMGWVVIGTMPLPGNRECLSNCRCVMEYRDESGRVLAA